MEYAIEVKNLTKKYDGFTLDQVSFQVPAGSIVGFIGENGAGKTTTIKAILDLIHKDGGEIKILEHAESEMKREVREQIGVVFDESYFPDNLKVPDVNSIMKNIYRTWNEGIFQSYIVKFQLPQNKIVKEFSRGMKMKLSIAAALSHNTKLLILDEATSGLDPIIRNEMLDIFMDFIQEEDHTVFLSSHITSDIEKMADYILLIHEGRIIFFETKDNLIYNYGIVRCNAEQFGTLDRDTIVGVKKNSFEMEALVNNKRELERRPHEYVIDRASIEDILLYIVRGENI